MNFASDFVYCEKSEKSQEKKKEKEKEKEKEKKKVLTNLVTIQLSRLENQSSLAAGEAVFCQKCRAVLNCFSKIVESEDGEKQTWKCEFCDQVNDIRVMEEEIPKKDEVDYILEVSSNVVKKRKVFVLDTSGSMCTTTEMSGKMPDRIKENEPKEDWGELGGFEQPQLPQGTWYMSRLQAIQSGISVQIDGLATDTCCSLITFDSDVTLHGDALIEPIVVAGDELQDKGALLKRGAGLEFKSDLSQSKQAFQKRLWSLQSGGATALGPAVALGVAMAAEVPGSSILVATDGLANIGVGNLEGATSGEQVAKCKAFYEDMAEYARAKSVTINVLSLASVGDNVNLSILGVLNDITGGTIDLVQPATVVEQVDELMKAEPVATDVTISILSHRLFKFRSPGDGPVEVEKKIEKEKAMRKEDEKEEEEEEEEQNAHVLKKSVGVASKLSEILFEFEQSNDSSNLPSHLPFQVQILYTRMDGTKAIRVITQMRRVTNKREDAEASVNVAVLSAAASKAATTLAAKGQYEEARKVAVEHEAMLSRAVHTDEQKALFQQYQREFSDIEGELQKQEQLNQDEFGGLDDLEMRTKVQTDDLSAVIWNQRSKQAQGCLVM